MCDIDAWIVYVGAWSNVHTYINVYIQASSKLIHNTKTLGVFIFSHCKSLYMASRKITLTVLSRFLTGSNLS